MKTLKLGNKMKTVDISSKKEPRCLVAVCRDGIFRPFPISMTTPIKALKRMVNLFEETNSFEDITAIKCYDPDSGVEQWELTIK